MHNTSSECITASRYGIRYEECEFESEATLEHCLHTLLKKYSITTVCFTPGQDGTVQHRYSYILVCVSLMYKVLSYSVTCVYSYYISVFKYSNNETIHTRD